MAPKSSVHPIPDAERKVRAASKARRDAEREALRAAILAAAGDVFLEKGFDEFSMRQVAARIGYSATTIYHHFVNKEDLLRALLDEAFREFGDAMERALAAEPDPMRRMGTLGKAYVRFGVAHPVHYQLMYLRRPDWLGGDDSHAATKAHHQSYNQLLVGVQEGVSKGWLPPAPPQALADWMWATVHGLVMLGLTEFRNDPERLEAAMALFDLPPHQHDAAPGVCR